MPLATPGTIHAVSTMTRRGGEAEFAAFCADEKQRHAETREGEAGDSSHGKDGGVAQDEGEAVIRPVSMARSVV